MRVSARIALLVLISVNFACAPKGGEHTGSPADSDHFDFQEPKITEITSLDPFPGVGSETVGASRNFDPYEQMLNQTQPGAGGSPYPPTSGTTVPIDTSTNIPGQNPPAEWQQQSQWNQQTFNQFAGRGGIVTELVSLGIMVFNLVQANQPQVQAETHRISVLPPATPETWEKMSGWTGPHIRTFQLQSKNRAGSTITNFQYKLIYYANGSLNGKGAYIANLQVVPEVVDVGWGFKFDVGFEVGDIINVGTPEDPIAGLHFQLQWKLHSAMKRVQGIDSYFLTGDSNLTVID